MPGSVSRKYWDAVCFLHFVNGHPLYLPTLEAALEDSAKGNIRILTSTLSVVEVAFGASEQKAGKLDVAVEERINDLWRDSATIELVEYHGRIAYKARELMRSGMEQGWRIKPADAIHLATASVMEVDEIHTYEPKWKTYAELVNIPVMEPYMPRPKRDKR